MLLPSLQNQDQGRHAGAQRRQTASVVNGLLRQDKHMKPFKRENWTEQEVLALPAGEHDYFDRKSGALLSSPDFRKDLAKALSAFANSGGGHLILGVADDGIFDGVDPVHRGRTSTKEWLEQVIPQLLSYPLEDFRVHAVIPDLPSAIPEGKAAIVIDVGDSVLAPHQSTEAKTYYYREGGHSKPAPHFYLEMVRNRLINPTLTSTLTGVRLVRAYRNPKDVNVVFVEAGLDFTIENAGRIAAYKWSFRLDEMSRFLDDRQSDYLFEYAAFSGSRPRSTGIVLDSTILPSLSTREVRDLGIMLRPVGMVDEGAIRKELAALFPEEFSLGHRVITETSRGEIAHSRLRDVINPEEWSKAIMDMLIHG